MNSLIIRRTPGSFAKALSQSRPLTSASRLNTTPFSRAAIPRAITPFRPQFPKTPNAVRYESSLTVPESEKDSAQTVPPPPPSYQLTFTCKPCSHRSSHRVTKQGYHHGTVLITCPSCKNRHVISDHLNIFMDEKSTLEDILKRKNANGDLTKLLKKGRLGMREGQLIGNESEQDIEFWEDGSETKHSPDGAGNAESK